MKWLSLLGLTLAFLVVAALTLRWVGERRWSESIHVHMTELDESRTSSPRQSPYATYSEARELSGLPAPVQRYFRAVLRDGQPIIAEATIAMTGTINLSTTSEQWKPFTSQQRAVTRRPGFLWDAKVSMFPGLSARVEDSYIAGRGRLVAKLLGLFTVAQVQAGGEIARGEFMRYFAEAAWYPTALLPSQGVQWHEVDGSSANATIVDGPITLTLLFRFNEAGVISTVRAESRGAGVGKDMVMLPWDCSLSDYEWHSGMLLPMTGEAAWIRPEGRKAYFVGHITSIHHKFDP
jgi:hypothetical protein